MSFPRKRIFWTSVQGRAHAAAVSCRKGAKTCCNENTRNTKTEIDFYIHMQSKGHLTIQTSSRTLHLRTIIHI